MKCTIVQFPVSDAVFFRRIIIALLNLVLSTAIWIVFYRVDFADDIAALPAVLAWTARVIMFGPVNLMCGILAGSFMNKVWEDAR